MSATTETEDLGSVDENLSKELSDVGEEDTTCFFGEDTLAGIFVLDILGTFLECKVDGFVVLD